MTQKALFRGKIESFPAAVTPRRPSPEQWQSDGIPCWLINIKLKRCPPPPLKNHNIVTLFWTYLTFQQYSGPSESTQFKFPAGQVAWISTFPCYSLHIIWRPFFTEEALPDLEWKLKLRSSGGGSKARSREGLINRDPERPRGECWEGECLLPPGRMWRHSPLSSVLLSCGASRMC